MILAPIQNMDEAQIAKVQTSVLRFTNWLDRFGEISYDHQSFFASDLARAAKALYYKKPLLGTLAVSPMIFCEAFLPSARRFFWKPQRFPIADAHYAMGFAFLSRALGQKQYYESAVHFLEVLKETRSPGFENYCWGYPFNWETRRGTMWHDTPLITTVPYVYEAFQEVYQIDGDPKWREIMHSIARHALEDYPEVATSPNASSSYYKPGADDDSSGVINASAYRAFLLTSASVEFSNERYRADCRQKSEFCSASAKSRWVVALLHGRDTNVRRSLSYMLCAESVGEDRGHHKKSGLHEGNRARS